jgi:hypothetical protein
MASTLFVEEASFAADYLFARVCFDEEAAFDDGFDTACVPARDEACTAVCTCAADVLPRLVCEAECDEVARCWCEATVRTDARDERPWRERTCVTGASRTGCDTASTRPGFTLDEERWFQRRSSSTVTLKRSATVTSVSPARVV